MKKLLMVAFLALYGLPVSGATCSSEVFVDATSYALPFQPGHLLVADLNNDGLPDIVATELTYYNNSHIAVLLGNADGTFQPPIVTLAVDGAVSIAAGLFNNDGNVDLVVGLYNGNVATYLGNGNGTFQAPLVSNFTQPVTTTYIAAGQFNADGKLDLVATGGSAVAMILGNGDGTFAEPVTYQSGGGSGSLAVGDLNGDGKLDVVTVSGTNTLAVLLGNGAGGLGPASSVVAGNQLNDVHLADLNNDGVLDVALISGGYAATLLGNGDGTFQAAISTETGSGGLSLATGDFDGDGRLDLAVLDQSGYSAVSAVVWILHGHGDGIFDGRVAYLPGNPVTAIVAADFGNEGRVDVAVASTTPPGITVMGGNGDGSLRAIRMEDFGIDPQTLTPGDFDGNGSLDLVATQYGSYSILLNDGAGGFTGLPAVQLPESPIGIGAADFDNDGVLDLLLIGYQTLYFLHGNGDGTFHDPVVIPGPGYSLAAPVVADFNNDGRPDVALTGQGPIQGQLAVLIGNGDGTFQSPRLSPIPASVTATLGTTADFDGDGRLDLAFITASGGFGGTSKLWTLKGFGDGTFGPVVPYGELSNPVGLVAANFHDWSSSIDIAVANAGDSTIAIFDGNGDGTFRDPIAIAKGWAPSGIAAGDFDGNNKLDIVVANGNASNVAVLLELSGGRFQSPVAFAVGTQPTPIVVGDFVRNGVPDVIVGNLGGFGGISLLQNTRLAVAPLPDTGACLGSTANLRAFAAGLGPVTYQWRKDGIPLTDGGNISGSTTSVLIVSNSGFSDQGAYDVVVTDLCSSVDSNVSNFTVDVPPPAPTIVVASSVPPSTSFLTASVANPTAGHTYSWVLTGAVITAGQGTSQITFTTGLPGTLTLEVTEYSVPTCGTSSSPVQVPIDYLDVPPSNPFHDDVVTIAQQGITAGCGGGNFCPGMPVTRAQMAVFLLKSKYGASHVPPVSGQYFTDVPPGSFAADWIDELASLGITSGCGNGLYCPNNSVTRAQMAVFLLKTLIGGFYQPPTAVGIFGDVPVGSFAADFIEDLYNRGITGGCSASPLLYCPNNPVNRGQMATFLVRTFLTP